KSQHIAQNVQEKCQNHSGGCLEIAKHMPHSSPHSMNQTGIPIAQSHADSSDNAQENPYYFHIPQKDSCSHQYNAPEERQIRLRSAHPDQHSTDDSADDTMEHQHRF